MLFPLLLLFWQVLCIVGFGVFTTYGTDLDAVSIIKYYPVFQDVHIMIFIGFGFLMTFLRDHRFGSVALNLLIGALALQTGILFNGFFHNLITNHWDKLELSILNLIGGDFAAGAVLISFGAMLGRVSPVQMVLITILELIVFAINEVVIVNYFEAVDMGGSMIVHAFGSFFGIACGHALLKHTKKTHPRNVSTYASEVIAAIGTIFLWCYWPSFNGALAIGSAQHRVIINTVLGLTGSCVTTFAVSRWLHGKIEPEDILNATLAGGVAIGSSSDLVVSGYVAILIGSLGGAVSVLGFRYLSPWLRTRFGINDTCGVNNLHGIPGILGGITGAVSAATVSSVTFGDEPIGTVFPAMGEGRSAAAQAGYQLAALALSLSMAVVGGTVTGYVTRCLPKIEKEYSDEGMVRDLIEETVSAPHGVELI